MKKALKGIVLVAFLLGVVFPLTGEAYVNVKGYYKSNGTYVAPHVRSNPNGLKYDNYGYTPSQGLYNPTYGTRGTEWDTPTYITDPSYYLGKALYESGSSGGSYFSSYSTPSTPSCPRNSYYDGISSCKCSSGYVNSGGTCVSSSSYCYSSYGYGAEYDSLSKSCRCSYGYVADSSNQCVSGNSYCWKKHGYSSNYTSYNNSCSCDSGYTFNLQDQCVRKSTTTTYTSPYVIDTSFFAPKTSSNYSGGVSNSGSVKSISAKVKQWADKNPSTDCYDSGYSDSLVSECFNYRIGKDKYTWTTYNDISGANISNSQTSQSGARNRIRLEVKATYDANTTCSSFSGKDLEECVAYAFNPNLLWETYGDTSYVIPSSGTTNTTNSASVFNPNRVRASVKSKYDTSKTCAGLDGKDYDECISYAYNPKLNWVTY